MNINVDINYEPLVYWETIPADCFPFQDSDHHVFLTTPPLRGGAMLHRFKVADGTEYSRGWSDRILSQEEIIEKTIEKTEKESKITD